VNAECGGKSEWPKAGAGARVRVGNRFLVLSAYWRVRSEGYVWSTAGRGIPIIRPNYYGCLGPIFVSES